MHLQICTLHESGLLSVWTIVNHKKSSTISITNEPHHHDHRSPWSTVHLYQSGYIELFTAIPLIAYSVRPKSGFQKNRSYFESNLFDDSVLQELHEISANNDDSGTMHFLDLELIDGDRFIVSTNMNVIIIGACSLHPDSIRKIIISDKKCMPTTQIRSIHGGRMVFLGFADGSVRAFGSAADDDVTFSNNYDLEQMLANDAHHHTLKQKQLLQINGKSCAIQNIISVVDERNDDNDDDAVNNVDVEMKPGDEEMSSLRKRLKSIYHLNGKVLLPGLTSLESCSSIKWIQYSLTSNRLIVQSGERVRLISLSNDLTCINFADQQRYSGVTLIKDIYNSEYLVSAHR